MCGSEVGFLKVTDSISFTLSASLYFLPTEITVDDGTFLEEHV